MSKKTFIGFMVLSLVFFGTLQIWAHHQTSPVAGIEIARQNETLLNSNLFTQPDDLRLFEQSPMSMDGFERTLQSDKLTLYIHPENLSIRLRNHDTEFIWSSNLGDEDGQHLNNVWRRTLNSGFSFDFFDRQNRRVSRTLLEATNRTVSMAVDHANQTVTIDVDVVNFDFRFRYQLSLDGDTMRFHLNTQDIEEYGTNRLNMLSVFEFLGAAKEDDVPGYKFIPSGSGALVRYTANPQISSYYRADFLGRDLYQSTNPNNLGLHFPVYGAVHGINQNAYFVTILEGAQFARYNYAPPGVRTPYHRHFKSFRLRESFIQNIPGSDTNPTIVQANIKDYNIVFDLTVLSHDDANYVGMARHFRSFLLNTNQLNPMDIDQAPTLHLDVFGSDYHRGLLFKQHHIMTTTQDVLTMHERLSLAGIQDIHFTLRGFTQGGYTDASHRHLRWNRRLGSFSDLDDLNTSLHFNPTIMHRFDQRPPRSTLVTISNTFGRTSLFEGDMTRFFVDSRHIVNHFEDAWTASQRYGGMALDGWSHLLYSNRNHTRTEMMTIQADLIQEPIPMYRPNQVMLPHTTLHLHTPANHERLRFLTDHVPFLHIVLSGSLPYYTSPLNVSANRRLSVLRAVDFGARPSFFVSAQQSHMLSRTLARNYFGMHFDSIEQQIIEDYLFIHEALEPVLGESIVKRDVLAQGVVRVVYSNDVELFINYSQQPFIFEGLVIHALDVAIRK